MRALLVFLALGAVGCGSSPTAPSAPVVTPPVVVVPPPVVQQMISVTPCPTSTAGVELGFYLEIGCNGFDLPLQPVRRWMVTPKLYLKTVDEAGAPIDAVTLDTVQNAMMEVAPALTNGKLSVSVERGTTSREGQSGWITVKWPTTVEAVTTCGRAQVGTDGGWIELHYKQLGCGCGDSAMRPLTARHELGHALGYWHTDNAGDLMYGPAIVQCDGQLSARERQAISYQYR